MSNQLVPSPFQELEIVDSPSVAELITQLKQGLRDFRGRDFANLDLSGLDLSHTDFRGANFFNAELRCVNFTGADLREVNFKGANLRSANFTQTDLTGANLVDIDLCHVFLTDANLKSAVFLRIKCFKTLFHNTQLPDGTLVTFKMRVSNPSLLGSDLITRYQKEYQQRKQLALFFVLNLGYCGLQIISHLTDYFLFAL